MKLFRNLFFILFASVLIISCDKTEETPPDLIPTQLFSSTSIAPGATVKEVIAINNGGGIRTTAPISFKVSKFPANSGLSIALNNSAGVVIGSDSIGLSNANWDTTSTATDIIFTSKPAFYIESQQAAYVGINIVRSNPPNQGTDVAVTQTVSITGGTGGNETPTTNNTTTTTITKITTPDLTASQFFSGLQIAAGGTIEHVIVITNIGSVPTTAPITFTVSNFAASSGLTVQSNNNATVNIGSNTFNLTNASDWNVTVGATALTFTSKAGVVIPAGGSKIVGVTITRAAAPNQGAGGVVTHTVTIVPGTGGGESPTTNNNLSIMFLKS